MCGQTLAPRCARGAHGPTERSRRVDGAPRRTGEGIEEGRDGGHAAIVGQRPPTCRRAGRGRQCFFLTVFFAGADFFDAEAFFDGVAFEPLAAFTLPWVAFAAGVRTDARAPPRAAFWAR